MKKWLWRIFWVLTALYLIAAVLVLPYLIRTQVPPAVSKAVGAPFAIEGASFNPFIMKLSLDGVRLQTPEKEPFFSLRRFEANVDLLPLLWGRICIARVSLVEPQVRIVQEAGGRFNFDWLTHLGGDSNATEADADRKEKTGLPAISLEAFSLSGGRVEFTDRSRPVPLRISLDPIGLDLRNIDTTRHGADDETLHFYAVTGSGSLVNLRTRIRSLDPVVVDGRFDYEAGQLYDAWHFLQEISALEVADGHLHLSFAYDANLSDLNATTLDDIRLSVEHLRIKPKAENADVLRLGSLRVEGGPVRPMAQYARVGSVALDDIFVALAHRRDGTVNWQHYFPAGESGREKAESGKREAGSEKGGAASPWDALVARFDLHGLRVSIDDEAISPPTHFDLDEFNLSARHISALPETPLSYDAALRFNGRFRCAMEGNVTHTPLDAGVLADCRGLDLTWFNPYVDRATAEALDRFDVRLRRAQLGFALVASAVDTNGTIAATVADANASLTGVKITPKTSRRHVLSFEALTVTGITASTREKKAGVKRIGLDGLDIAAAREKDGGIDAAKLVVPKTGKEESGTRNTEHGTRNTEPGTRNTEHGARNPEKTWFASVGTLAVNGAHLTFHDRALRTPVTTTLERFDLKLRGITTDPSRPIRIENGFSVDRKGRITARGELVQKPLRADIDLAVDRFSLPPLSPYVEELTWATVDDGSVRMNAHVAYAPSENAPDLTARGDFYLDDLLVSDTRDGMPLVSMKALNAKKYLFQLNPGRFFVDTVELDSFYANIVIDENKSLNLASVMRESAQKTDTNATRTAEANATEKEPFPVRIVRFIVKNGAVHFADYSLPLQFDTQVHDVNGEVLGISTLSGDTTYLRVDGEIDRYGVAKAEGSLNTGDPKTFTDIGVEFRNIDLSSFTPYSGEFVGRAIDSGKLSVGLRYNIVDSKMKGENSLVIKQIVLGREIESNESVSLPLDFAIALLEDDDGVIDIEMPVQGDVDNPDFKWGGVVWNAFVNLLTKAVTAPFDLIGSMLGIEGDELKYVDFEPGRATLDAASRERLDLLGKVLGKRPKLGLEITPAYDAKRDTAGLKRAALLKEVLGRGSKEKIGARSALAPGLLEPIYVERLGQGALEALREATAKDKNPEVAYKEALIEHLVETQPLPANALETLAKEREQAIRSYLLVTHGIAANRITAKAPEAVESETDYVPVRLGLDAAKE